MTPSCTQYFCHTWKTVIHKVTIRTRPLNHLSKLNCSLCQNILTVQLSWSPVGAECLITRLLQDSAECPCCHTDHLQDSTTAIRRASPLVVTMLGSVCVWFVGSVEGTWNGNITVSTPDQGLIDPRSKYRAKQTSDIIQYPMCYYALGM